MFSREYWVATAERVVRAFAVTLLATLGTGAALDLRDVDWRASLTVAGGAALLNLLVSVAAGAGIGPRGSPSLVRDPAAAAPVDPVVALADRDARRADPGQHRL